MLQTHLCTLLVNNQGSLYFLILLQFSKRKKIVNEETVRKAALVNFSCIDFFPVEFSEKRNTSSWIDWVRGDINTDLMNIWVISYIHSAYSVRPLSATLVIIEYLDKLWLKKIQASLFHTSELLESAASFLCSSLFSCRIYERKMHTIKANAYNWKHDYINFKARFSNELGSSKTKLVTLP